MAQINRRTNIPMPLSKTETAGNSVKSPSKRVLCWIVLWVFSIGFKLLGLFALWTFSLLFDEESRLGARKLFPFEES